MITPIPQLGEAGRTCSSCRYFDAAAGLCRFNSPSPVGWPAAGPDDWCGEWATMRTQMQRGEAADVEIIRGEVDAERRAKRLAGGRR